MEWQDIATAPKDEDVLLYQEGWGVRTGYWDCVTDDCHFWYAVETQGVSGGIMEPTHWMPLPPAPQEPAE